MSDRTPAVRELHPAPVDVIDDPRVVMGYSEDEFNAFTRKAVNWAAGGIKKYRLVVGVALAEALNRWGSGADYDTLVDDYKKLLDVDRSTLWRWRLHGEEVLGLKVGRETRQAIEEKADPAIEAPKSPVEGSAAPTGAAAKSDEGGFPPAPSSPAAPKSPSVMGSAARPVGSTPEITQPGGGALDAVPGPDGRATSTPSPEVAEKTDGHGEPQPSAPPVLKPATSGRSRPVGATEPSQSSPPTGPNAEAVEGHWPRVVLPQFPMAEDNQTVVRWLTSRTGSLNKITERDLDALEELVKQERKQRAASNGSLVRREVQPFAKKGGK